MSCKSALYGANLTLQNIAVGGTINFGQIVRKFGKNLNLTGGNVSEMGIGYYKHTVNLDITGTTAGDVTIQMFKDGVAIAGAGATITTATGDNYSTSFSFMTREFCCCDSVITAIVTGVATSISSASIVSEKV